MSGYEALARRSRTPKDVYVPSVCSTIVGPPYPRRGVAAGVLEVIAGLFFPTPLRVVVIGVGVLRVIQGIGKF